jgi:hypothetical protein
MRWIKTRLVRVTLGREEWKRLRSRAAQEGVSVRVLVSRIVDEWDGLLLPPDAERCP